MLLSKVLQSGVRYRVALQTPTGAGVFDVELIKETAHKSPGFKVRKTATDRGFLANARFFEADDASELLTFWQEGKGVSVELAGWVPYSAVLSIEPVE